jgi:hypothetical protein
LCIPRWFRTGSKVSSMRKRSEEKQEGKEGEKAAEWSNPYACDGVQEMMSFLILHWAYFRFTFGVSGGIGGIPNIKRSSGIILFFTGCKMFHEALPFLFIWRGCQILQLTFVVPFVCTTSKRHVSPPRSIDKGYFIRLDWRFQVRSSDWD